MYHFDYNDLIRLTQNNNGMWPDGEPELNIRYYMHLDEKYGNNINNWSKKALAHVSFKNLDYKAKSLSLKQTQQNHCIAISLMSSSADFDNYGPEDRDWLREYWIFWVDQMGVVASMCPKHPGTFAWQRKDFNQVLLWTGRGGKKTMKMIDRTGLNGRQLKKLIEKEFLLLKKERVPIVREEKKLERKLTVERENVSRRDVKRRRLAKINEILDTVLRSGHIYNERMKKIVVKDEFKELLVKNNFDKDNLSWYEQIPVVDRFAVDDLLRSYSEV